MTNLKNIVRGVNSNLINSIERELNKYQDLVAKSALESAKFLKEVENTVQIPHEVVVNVHDIFDYHYDNIRNGNVHYPIIFQNELLTIQAHIIGIEIIYDITSNKFIPLENMGYIETSISQTIEEIKDWIA